MYTINPKMPKIRRDAVFFAEKHGVRCSARHYGFSPGTISKWKQKMLKQGYGPISTLSSRPHRSPRRISAEIVLAITNTRKRTKRCAEVVHAHVIRQGHQVSLSTVKRTLDRAFMIKKRSPWKRMHTSPKRPPALNPGDLLQIDTIHLWQDGLPKTYIYTIVDVYSRWSYAWATDKVGCGRSLAFLKKAQQAAPFRFRMLQTDHGPEFTKYFSQNVSATHRHSRVRKPNDNAHVERFNRTIKDECIRYQGTNINKLNTLIQEYILHYNQRRLHLSLNLKTPLEFIRCFQGVG